MFKQKSSFETNVNLSSIVLYPNIAGYLTKTSFAKCQFYMFLYKRMFDIAKILHVENINDNYQKTTL